MTITNAVILDAYANIAQRTYDQDATTPNVSAGANGTYTEITQVVDGSLGFQARAFFNDTANEFIVVN